MPWTIDLKESVIKDLRWFGKKDGRLLLKEALRLLSEDPQIESRNMKTLRPNSLAQKELRIFGKYRVLFNVNARARKATILVVGEKRGHSLIVQGEEFSEHHESDSVD